MADFLSPTLVDHPELDDAVALTYLTCDLATGIVTDADVLFNDNLDFAIGRDGGTGVGGANAGQPCATGADDPGLRHIMDYPRLFPDGFESGDFSAWTTVSGGPRD